MPVITDILAHHFWKEAHLKIVHKENGKEHVHFELVKSMEGSEKEKQAGTVKYEINDYAYFVAVASCHFFIAPFSILFYPYHILFYDLVFPGQDYIPPKRRQLSF